MKISIWRTVGARREEVDGPKNGKCQDLDGFGWHCLNSAYWSLAWTVNESGLPGMGEPWTRFVCDEHLASRCRAIPFSNAGAVTITPFEEV